MARIDCVVDTQPMAEEIKSVSHQINDTTTAVVAMKAAIVLAEQQAADMVCRNVNKGFYTLMRSQISQKIAKLQSEVDSQLMQLNTQRKQLQYAFRQIFKTIQRNKPKSQTTHFRT